MTCLSPLAAWPQGQSLEITKCAMIVKHNEHRALWGLCNFPIMTVCSPQTPAIVSQRGTYFWFIHAFFYATGPQYWVDKNERERKKEREKKRKEKSSYWATLKYTTEWKWSDTFPTARTHTGFHMGSFLFQPWCVCALFPHIFMK